MHRRKTGKQLDEIIKATVPYVCEGVQKEGRRELRGDCSPDGREDEARAGELEALRMVVSTTVTGGETRPLLIADVSRAYMYAKCDTPMYVKL